MYLYLPEVVLTLEFTTNHKVRRLKLDEGVTLQHSLIQHARTSSLAIVHLLIHPHLYLISL